MRRKLGNYDLVTRLSSSNISTKDFKYLTELLTEETTCVTCTWIQDDVCVNGDSPICCEIPPKNYGCSLWVKIYDEED